MPLWLELSIVFALILLNGLFAMSELAIVSARRALLRQRAEAGQKGAETALEMAENPNSFLSVVQVGITLNGVFTGVFSGATMADPLRDWLRQFAWIEPYSETTSVALTIVGVTYFSLIIGELIPKRVGLAYAEPIAVRVAGIMRCFATAAAPVVWFLGKSTESALKLMRLANPPETPVTPEEVKDMIAEGTETGVFKPAEKDMLEGVMRLAGRSVRSIMTPRIDMVWLSIEDDAQDVRKEIRASGYSRFPVARGDLEEIVGVVHAKDLLNAAFDGQTLALKSVMRPPLVVPDTTPVLRLLEQFRQSGQHIAVVADEYGSVEGLVSITDILQAITGDLPERGQDMAMPPVRRVDGSWLIDGMTPIDEVETLLGLKTMRGDGGFHTLAGFIIEKLGRLPAVGDSLIWNEARFEVIDMDGRRIDKALVMPPPDDEDEDDDD